MLVHNQISIIFGHGDSAPCPTLWAHWWRGATQRWLPRNCWTGQRAANWTRFGSKRDAKVWTKIALKYRKSTENSRTSMENKWNINGLIGTYKDLNTVIQLEYMGCNDVMVLLKLYTQIYGGRAESCQLPFHLLYVKCFNHCKFCWLLEIVTDVELHEHHQN